MNPFLECRDSLEEGHNKGFFNLRTSGPGAFPWYVPSSGSSGSKWMGVVGVCLKRICTNRRMCVYMCYIYIYWYNCTINTPMFGYLNFRKPSFAFEIYIATWDLVIFSPQNCSTSEKHANLLTPRMKTPHPPKWHPQNLKQTTWWNRKKTSQCFLG